MTILKERCETKQVLKYNFLEKKLKWNSIHHLGTKYIAKINKLQRWSFLSVIHEMNVHEWRVLNFAKFFIIFELLTARSSEPSLGFWFRDEGGPDMYILQCLFLFRLNCCDYNWKKWPKCHFWECLHSPKWNTNFVCFVLTENFKERARCCLS